MGIYERFSAVLFVGAVVMLEISRGRDVPEGAQRAKIYTNARAKNW